jgi:superfamily I DNA/RNA helicase
MFDEYHRMRESKYHGEMDAEDYALKLLAHIGDIPETLKYDYIFVDEVQDFQPMQLLVLAQLCRKGLTMSGDPRQRIYRRSPVSFRNLGIDIEGRRTRNLRINYRSTRQIMRFANSVQFTDWDRERIPEQNFGRQGPLPVIRRHDTIPSMTGFMVAQTQKLLEVNPAASGPSFIDTTTTFLNRSKAPSRPIWQKNSC